MCTVFYEWILILSKIYIEIFMQKLGERQIGISFVLPPQLC